ncbi:MULTISPECIES: protein kinase domain-containing protein [Bacillaceae]|uniref:protein kinase domain-containing protein n=1 Tax=Bacillaceae TaxID=186817 RepID=UPI000BFB9423|nr:MULTISPECIES: serine/threonine-protein kinase [Bacillaceae]PGT90940.1 serine/threonine protein kinase [Bacillus sp. AFS040349]UGB31075.1 serine/threonine-protein kinase [Metabacillus sp. B2-18]
MNQACNLSPGTTIVGKWNGESYTIIKALGQGATGSVYLGDSRQGKVAIKLSENSMAITSEVNVLKHFSKVQGTSLGPSLLDVDDWKDHSQKLTSFYVMEYVQGKNFLEFVEQRGIEWSTVLTLQLLTNLEKLHQEGWVFGDLKPENLIVSGPPPKIRCIDVGGTTQQGRSIKEFTEFFDRGYWGMGNRKAEPTYDLFSVAMIIINAAYPKRFKKMSDRDGQAQLMDKINQHPFLNQHRDVLQQALLGKYTNAQEMKSGFIQLLSNKASKDKPRSQSYQTRVSKQQQSPPKGRQSTKKKTQPQPQHSRTQVKQNKKKQKKRSHVLETLVILIGVFVVYSLYVYHVLM